MENQNSIKTDLFRFISLRSPQTISSKRKELGFIHHPKANHSFFLTELTGSKNIDDLRNVLEERTNDFNPFKSVNQIKKIGLDNEEEKETKLYEFSTWLSENQNNITKELVHPKVKNLKPLLQKHRLILWDNLFYDLLKVESIYIRQACIQLIIADNFVRKIKSSQLKAEAFKLAALPKRKKAYNDSEIINSYLTQVAKAKIIVPKFQSIDRSLRSESINDIPQTETEQVYLKSMQRHIQKDFQERKKELLNLKSEHEFTLNKAISDDINRRKAIINKEKEKIKFAFPKASEEELLLKIHEIEQPEIKVEVPRIFSSKFTKKKISNELNNFLEFHSLRNSNFTKGYNLLEKLKKRELKKIQKQLVYKKNISVQGVNMKLEMTAIDTYTFGFRFHDLDPTKGMVYLLVYTQEPGVEIVSADYKITLLNSEVSIESTKFKVISNWGDPFCHINLFNEKFFSMSKTGLYKFDGQFLLSSGKRLEIHFTSHASVYKKSGKVSVLSEEEKIPVNGIHRIGVADYFKVEQELCCYEPGEVSHIENIMAREYKERSTRNLISSEDQLEESLEIEMEQLSDLATTDRNELNSEIEATLTSENSRNSAFSTDFNFTYGTKGGPSVAFNIGANMDFSSSNSSSNSNALAKTYAKEITERALKRVVKKTATKRTSIIRKEFEENNRHGFDNRKGEKHVSGVYRWVDKIYTNRLINYGNRLMYEFMIPEPSYVYKHALAQAVNEGTISQEEQEATGVLGIPTEIKLLADFFITEEEDFTYDEAIEAAKYYENLGASPIQSRIENLGKEFISRPFTLRQKSNISFKWDEPTEYTFVDDVLMVPDNYEVYKVDGDHVHPIFNIPFPFIKVNLDYYKTDGGQTNRKCDIRINNKIQTKKFDAKLNPQEDVYFSSFFDINDDPFSVSSTKGNMLPISVSGMAFKDVQLQGTIQMRLINTVKQNWQVDIYKLLDDAREEVIDLQKLTDEFSEPLNTNSSDTKEDSTTINPQFNRQIEQRELKRLAIEMLTSPFGKTMGGKFYEPKGPTCNLNDDTTYQIPHIKQDNDLNSYGATVKFFEQAFDWDIMSYIFYPYYWADKCNWRDLIRTNDGDPLFQSFLRSGMSRVVVPVTLGFEEAVTYYINSGEVWNGNKLVVDSDSDIYVSIVDEMTASKGIVEDEWETRVPTSLTLIQSDTVSLQASGLPCCHERDKTIVNNKIIHSSNLLKGDKFNDAQL